MVFRRTYEFDSGLFPPVIATTEGLRSPRSLEIDSTKVTSYAGAEGRTQRILAPGCYAGSVPGSSKVRAIPRTDLGAALTAASTTSFTVAANTARNFIAGEELVVIAPYQTYTFAQTWAADDTATVVIDGYSVTSTAVGADLAVEAGALATAINADPYIGRQVVAIADGTDTVYVYAYDMRSLYSTTASATTAGNGTLTAGGAAMAVNSTAIGTISAVNAETDTITLSAASSLTLPSGFKIGVVGSKPYDSNGDGYGVICPQQEVDLEWGADNNKGLYTSGSLLRALMPYVDGELEALFPEIQFVGN